MKRKVMMIITMVKVMNLDGHCIAFESIMERIINQLCQQLIMNITNDDINQ